MAGSPTPSPITPEMRSPTAAPPVSETMVSVPTDTVVPSEVPVPTEPPVPPTDTPLAPVEATPSLESGGLGLTKAAWEQLHGSGTQGIIGQAYENQKYDVSFSGSESTGPINMLWVYYRPTGATLEVARAESKLLIPKDAQLIRQPNQQDTGVLYVVDEYMSPSLVGLYQPIQLGKTSLDPWKGAEPGTFYVMFKQFPEGIPSFVINIGSFEGP